MPINKERLEKRSEYAQHRPDFVRPESWRYKRLETSWRKPKGVDNHQRKQKSRGRPGIVKIGYGGPRDSRGLHPSGYTDNMIYCVADFDGLNPGSDGLRIGHSVGTKKRREIMSAAVEKKFKVFNARVSASGNQS